MRSLTLLVLALAVPASGAPVAGTCAVTGMKSVVRSLGLEFTINPPVDFSFAVSVDPATGSFAFDRTGWPPHYQFRTVSTVHGFLSLPQDTITGTIDAAGNVALPGFTMGLSTDLTDPESSLSPVPFVLGTGLGAAVLGVVSYVVQGTPLNFETGALTLEGHAPSLDAPTGPTTSGLKIACTLAPVPTGLPKAPALRPPSGKIKIGPDLPATPPASGPVPGDTLKLKATLKRGAAALNANDDVWIRLQDGTGAEVALLLVAKAALQAKGKTLTATDTDGTLIQVLVGRKKNAQVSADLGGKLVLKSSKKGVTLSLQESGLALGGLTASGTLNVQLGTQFATTAVTVKGTGTTRKLK
jgi:hypothetical protein